MKVKTSTAATKAGRGKRSATPSKPPAGSRSGSRSTSAAGQRGTGRSAQAPSARGDARLLRLPDGSRSVQSPWVWRGFLFMSFIALGLCINFTVGHKLFYAASWGFVTAGWLAISMWLWRKHVRDDDEWRARSRGGRAA
jgi:hypothetical protein